MYLIGYLVVLVTCFLECCPLVQEIISVTYYLSCFGGGLLLCLFTGISKLGVYFFAPPPFSGAGSVFHLLPPLSMFDFSLQFVFQFCSIVWFRMLLSGSGDQLCDPLPSLLQGVAYRPPAVFTAFPVLIFYLVIYFY
jgi:hypothetical protein